MLIYTGDYATRIMKCNFPSDNSTCRIVNKDSPFDESNESIGRGLCHENNEMQFSDRQLHLSDRQ